MDGISVIIPTYNRAETLRITLDSLIAQNYPADMYEMIVADNNSTDDTRSVVESFMDNEKGVKVRYMFEPRQGVHYARNSAARIALYELLYYTDDDVIADPNLLVEIIKPFEFDPEVGTATGRVLPKWQAPPPQWILKHCYNSLLSLLDPPEEFVITRQISMLYSCHQAVRKDVLFQAGGFNPENTKGVWIGDGETGLILKIQDLGYKFGFNGASITYHVIPASRMTQSYLDRRIGNSGFVHAYTNYWRLKPTSGQLVARALKRTCLSAPKHLLSLLARMISEQDIHYSRFILAYTFYYLNRLLYDYRLLTDPKWREFVLRQDWIKDKV